MKQVDKKIKLVFYRTLYSQSGASLTMGGIASFLRKYGHKVDLCFLERKDLHVAEKILSNRGRCNIIIAKPNFKDFDELFLVLNELKKNKFIDFVFLCGPYACLNAESIMKVNDWLDGIVTGAIEETVLELVESINSRRKVFNVKCCGGIWRDSLTGIIYSNKKRSALMALNDLPFPARDIEMQENINFINIEASRGCNFSCSFCHNPIMVKFNNKKGNVDIRDSILVVDEMEKLHKNLGKTLFIFNDDCFWRGPIDNKRILKFCSEIKKRKLKIRFYIYLRCKPFVDNKILKELVGAGLVRVFLGVESASEKSQSVFNKPIEQDLYFTIKNELDKYNINIHIGYIVFEPYSTLKDIFLNINYLFKIGKLFRLGTILEPVRIVPSSELHIRLLKDGLMSGKLKYNQVTYGYKFLYPETRKLLNHLRKIFNNDLNGIAQEYEYYCTTANLMEVLIMKEGEKLRSITENDFTEFNKTRDESTALLKKYLDEVIRNVGSNNKDKQLDNNFVKDFKLLSINIKIKYANIVTKTIECGGRNIIKEIYTGLDRL